MPASDAEGSVVLDFGVNCFTEFDPLKCIIIGYVDETATSILEFYQTMLERNYSST